MKQCLENISKAFKPRHVLFQAHLVYVDSTVKYVYAFVVLLPGKYMPFPGEDRDLLCQLTFLYLVPVFGSWHVDIKDYF